MFKKHLSLGCECDTCLLVKILIQLILYKIIHDLVSKEILSLKWLVSLLISFS